VRISNLATALFIEIQIMAVVKMNGIKINSMV
jgi:hypothetical protein